MLSRSSLFMAVVVGCAISNVSAFSLGSAQVGRRHGSGAMRVSMNLKPDCPQEDRRNALRVRFSHVNITWNDRLHGSMQ
jgi:hypothetical protein